ncbi:MAG: DUF1573 domain-containing protein [Candidatus Krumholzibacteriota bacterium]
MRNATASFFLILTATALLTAPAAAQVISIDPQSFDFGDMKQQETKIGIVTVTNDGAGQLQIKDVKADCGCTVPTLTNNTLAPGESTQIEITFNSKKFNGTVYKTVNIISNDPVNPQVDVMIRATVHTPLIIDPVNQRVGFTRSIQGEVHSKNVTFTAVDAPDLEIQAAKTRKGLFQVKTIDNHDGNPQVSLLEITVPADMKPGRHRDHVRVKTNVEDMATVDIEMQAWVVQNLICSPEQVSFRYKKDFRQTIRVSPFEKGTEFKVTGADIDLPEISVEVMETIPNQETKVILTGKPISSDDPRAQKTKGHIKGTLTIHTDQPDTPTIIIPVTYMVRL